MAKATKTKNDSLTESILETEKQQTGQNLNEEVFEVEKQKLPEERVYEESLNTVMASETNTTTVTESDEIVFLRRILQIQNDGGFGNHLNKLINDRIKSLS